MMRRKHEPLLNRWARPELRGSLPAGLAAALSPSGGPRDAQAENQTCSGGAEAVSVIKEAFGYVPREDSTDPVDILINKRIRAELLKTANAAAAATAGCAKCGEPAK